MEYYVYVIKSLKDRWVYVGITNNVKNRLKLHSTEKVRSTKSKVPFILKYAENCKDSKETENIVHKNI